MIYLSEELNTSGQQQDIWAKKTGEPKKTEKPKLYIPAEIYDWVQSIMMALVVCILVFMFIGRGVDVIGQSMLPTLEWYEDANGNVTNDKLFISNLFYTIKNGDIVVFRDEGFRDEPLVKRVIAVAGQTVDIDFEQGIVYVDGQALDEPYTNAPTYQKENFDGEVTVPEGYLFVMGDNRNNSTDSRDDRIGFVDVRCLLGKAYFRFYPFSRIGLIG